MLEIDNVSVSYAGVQVLWDARMQVQKGEIVTLIGSNGTGKSTLVASIFGLVPVKSGKILFKGEEITGMPTYEVVKRGLALVPEKRELFPKMTVRENLVLGRYTKEGTGSMEHVFELFPALRERLDQIAGTLSGGEQQMLAIARSLMSEPELLVLDEPSLGLSPKLVLMVLETIRRLNREGLTILLVEQNVRHALEISSRGYIMENGRIVRGGAAAELLKDEEVKATYLGM